MHENINNAQPNHEGHYAVMLNGLGLFITAGVDDEGQPYVSINTENMAPEHTYDATTGLRGDASPYEFEEAEGSDAYIVTVPSESSKRIAIAHHLPQPGAVHARLAASQHAKMLNEMWPTVCGMPILSVHLGDAELYDAREHGAPTEEMTGELSDRTDLADFRAAEEAKTDA